uniref:beta-carotene 3-hydroxylase n=1 Tax=Crocus sativus TaxID=82528 RepID=Q5QGM4_CROSA|nr:beta carotene hydroxylase [Crocus sativus]
MTASISPAATTLAASSRRPPAGARVILFSPLSVRRVVDLWPSALGQRRRRRRTGTVFFVLAEEAEKRMAPSNRAAERSARKRSERRTYLIAAVMSSLGITFMAAAAVYYRFAWQMEGGDVPMTEMAGTFRLSVGGGPGDEFWPRWPHRASATRRSWHMHESHPPAEGKGPLSSSNDVFAIINAVPAIALLAFGFFHRGLLPGLCFGAGLGITLFGIAYMFVHDGLVHRRFPVGPIADLPYFQRVAAAHQIHHSEKFQGVPYGLFMGPKELEEVGGLEELEKEVSRLIKANH